eukprot:m.188160 g.188160  ORF g.188160 m.188160 type:complete len:584 (+) comp24814_c0_seq1:360-2111(+)
MMDVDILKVGGVEMNDHPKRSSEKRTHQDVSPDPEEVGRETKRATLAFSRENLEALLPHLENGTISAKEIRTFIDTLSSKDVCPHAVEAFLEGLSAMFGDVTDLKSNLCKQQQQRLYAKGREGERARVCIPNLPKNGGTCMNTFNFPLLRKLGDTPLTSDLRADGTPNTPTVRRMTVDMPMQFFEANGHEFVPEYIPVILGASAVLDFGPGDKATASPRPDDIMATDREYTELKWIQFVLTLYAQWQRNGHQPIINTGRHWIDAIEWVQQYAPWLMASHNTSRHYAGLNIRYLHDSRFADLKVMKDDMRRCDATANVMAKELCRTLIDSLGLDLNEDFPNPITPWMTMHLKSEEHYMCNGCKGTAEGRHKKSDKGCVHYNHDKALAKEEARLFWLAKDVARKEANVAKVLEEAKASAEKDAKFALMDSSDYRSLPWTKVCMLDRRVYNKKGVVEMVVVEKYARAKFTKSTFTVDRFLPGINGAQKSAMRHFESSTGLYTIAVLDDNPLDGRLSKVQKRRLVIVAESRHVDPIKADIAWEAVAGDARWLEGEAAARHIHDVCLQKHRCVFYQYGCSSSPPPIPP